MKGITQHQMDDLWLSMLAKWRANPAHGTYRQVEEAHDMSQTSLLQQQQIGHEGTSSRRTRFLSRCASFAKCMFALTYILMAFYVLTFREKDVCVLGNEGMPC